MKDYSVDELTITQADGSTQLRLKAWVLSDSYTISVYSGTQKIAQLKPDTARYDVCAAFHMPIEDNTYGIDQTVGLKGTYRSVRIVVTADGEDFCIGEATDETPGFLEQTTAKLSALSRNIRRGLRWAWNDYHFLVPPAVLAEKLRSEKRRTEQSGEAEVLDPRDPEQYAAWLAKQTYENESGRADVTFVTRTPRTFRDYPCLCMDTLQPERIHTAYTCFAGKDADLYEPFYAYLPQCEGYDLCVFDSDRLDADGNRCDPQLKPEYSPDTLRGVNYIGSVFAVRTECLKDLAGMEMDPYRILLELSEKDLKTNKIDKVLFSDQKSTDTKKTLDAFFRDHGIDAETEEADDACITRYALKEEPLISIIIPTKDLASDLETCVNAVLEKTDYKNYEILILDNNSEEEETFRYFEDVQKKHANVRVIEMKIPFNYSRLNNIAVSEYAKGEYIVLLNNDTELISGSWLKEMLGWAQLETTGTVGIRLLFADNTIQHAGILMGKGGIAGHAHHGGMDNEGCYYDLRIPYNVSGNTAACLMIKKDRYIACGMMDEELQVAFNDVDLNLRLREKGYRNIFLPYVRMHHYESKSRGNDIAGEKLKRYMNECVVIRQRWGKYIDKDPYYNSSYSLEADYFLKGQ
ncbi:MAG: glycosyltransferase [Solobacterium sp.]|nr:glycosyltransferase [Solobacterium sp.]